MKRKTLSILILVGFAILAVFFLRKYKYELVNILKIDLKYVLLVFVLIIFADILRGHMFKLLMENHQVRLKFKEWLGLQVLTAFWNSLTPFKSGGPAKAVYLKKKYGFPYTLFASVAGVIYLNNFLISGIFGIILSFFLPVSEKIKYSLALFFIIIFCSILFLLFFLPLPVNTSIKWIKYIVKSINEIQHIRKEYLLISKLILNTIMRFIVSALTLYFAFHAFGSEASLYSCLIMNLILSFSTIISITPMELGFRESIIAISSELFGTGTLTGVFVVTLDRIVTMLWLFMVTPIFSYILSQDFRSFKEIIKPKEL